MTTHVDEQIGTTTLTEEVDVNQHETNGDSTNNQSDIHEQRRTAIRNLLVKKDWTVPQLVEAANIEDSERNGLQNFLYGITPASSNGNVPVHRAEQLATIDGVDKMDIIVAYTNKERRKMETLFATAQPALEPEKLNGLQKETIRALLQKHDCGSYAIAYMATGEDENAAQILSTKIEDVTAQKERRTKMTGETPTLSLEDCTKIADAYGVPIDKLYPIRNTSEPKKPKNGNHSNQTKTKDKSSKKTTAPVNKKGIVESDSDEKVVMRGITLEELQLYFGDTIFEVVEASDGYKLSSPNIDEKNLLKLALSKQNKLD